MAEIIYGNQDRSSIVTLAYPIAVTATKTSGQIGNGIALDAAGGTWVHRAWLEITTVATGACTLDIGIAADSTTSSDVLLDGVDVNAAIGIKDSADGTDNGTNGVAKPQLATNGKVITVSRASGDANGLVGTLYVMVSGH